LEEEVPAHAELTLLDLDLLDTMDGELNAEHHSRTMVKSMILIAQSMLFVCKLIG